MDPSGDDMLTYRTWAGNVSEAFSVLKAVLRVPRGPQHGAQALLTGAQGST